VEAEGVIQPARNSKFDFSVAWLNARYAEFLPQPTVNWAGKKLDRSPEWTFTAGYTQTFELSGGGNIQAGVRTRVSDSYRLAALGTLNQFRVPGYTKTDVTLTYNAPDSRWYVQGFGKNLENAVVVTTAASGTFATVAVADPRTYGVRAGFKF
jgi:iron complex outermembrane receptor protein